MKRYFTCGVPGVEPGYLVYLYCLTLLGLQTRYKCASYVQSLTHDHGSRSLTRFIIYHLWSGMDSNHTLALVIGCVIQYATDLSP